MDAGTLSAAAGTLAAQVRLDVIAHNLANVGTPGYKAARLVQQAKGAGEPTAAPAVSTPLNEVWTETDFAQGAIRRTGNPLDVAISGRGFLLVDTERGSRLTRRGNLGVDAEGFLATADGLRVQGEGGDVAIGDGEVVIAPDGQVRVNGQSVGTLRFVDVADPARLGREEGTLFAPGEQALIDVPAEETQVLQGALETANFSPVTALVGLIETTRGFETYVRAAQRLDQITARAITDVGRV